MQAVGLVWSEVDQSAPDFRAKGGLIEGPRHPGAKLTFDVWQERMAQGGFVVGRDIPSRALGGVLRNLAVYEPLEGGEDFRIRVAGTAFFADGRGENLLRFCFAKRDHDLREACRRLTENPS